MLYVKTSKKIAGGLYLGKSRIDGKSMYRFKDFEELLTCGLTAEECELITAKNSVDYNTIKEEKLNKMIR